MRSIGPLVRLSLILGGLIALAIAPLTGQTIRAAMIVPPHAAWDTTDHVDLLAGHGRQLTAAGLDSTGHRVPNEPLRWFTVDSSIVKVSAHGVATGVHRGQTFVGVEIGTPGHGSMHALLLACVNDSTRTELHIVQQANHLVRPAANTPATARAQMVTSVQLTAVDLRSPSIAWDGPCVHWAPRDSLLVLISRRGLLTLRPASAHQGSTGLFATVGIGRAIP